jgi:transcriptional regulator with XRE-family HTH domain
MTQDQLAAEAGVAQGTISAIENGRKATISLLVLVRAARACNTSLHAYLEWVSGADEPRDIVHLRTQQLLIDLAARGGWKGTPEAAIDNAASGSRAVDVLLERDVRLLGPEVAVMEVIDWFADVGAAMRDWDRRLARVEQRAIALRTREGGDGITVPRVSGCWIVRATARNRALVGELRGLFHARFRGSGRHWVEAIRSSVPIPSEAAMLWVSVSGDRIWPARL